VAGDGGLEAGVVLDLFGLGDLAAGQALLDDDDVELASAGVDPAVRPAGPPPMMATSVCVVVRVTGPPPSGER
jgi:hypothetical protein